MLKSSRKPFLLFFLLVVAFELIFLSYLVLGQRMVIGHDGFELFAHQWFFINSAVSHHEFPLWSPFLNHGTPVWSYFIYSRMDMLANAMMLFASPLIKHGNFLWFFYASLFFDKFILISGVWLLAKRYFSSPVTVFFVASTVAATTITYTQNSFPLVMLYSIPLIIYLLHKFLDAFNWKWLFLAVYFFVVVSINVFYFIPVITLSIFVYFITAAILTKGDILKGFNLQAKDMWWIVGIILVLLMLGLIYCLGHDPWMYVNATKRQSDGGVPLDVFLSYGGDDGLIKWWELFLGLSFRLDYTLYMGILSVPLIVIGIFFSKNRNRIIFLVGAIFFFLFAAATPVSVLAYYGWPLMKVFRHISYVAPLIKLFLCFLAGFGFERLFCPLQDQQTKDIFKISMLASVMLILNAVFLCQLVINPALANFIFFKVGSPQILNKVAFVFISQYFYGMALSSLLVAVILFFRPFINFSKYAASYTIILLFMHLGIIGWYALDEIQLRTFQLSPEEYSLMDFQKIPYLMRRDDGTQASGNPREAIINDLQGSMRNSVNNFTFSDMVTAKQPSDFYLRPFYNLSTVLKRPEHATVLFKLTGASQDKIQFFSKAYLLGSSTAVASILFDKKYEGDMLFYQSLGRDRAGVKDEGKGLDLSKDERLSIPYKVLDFSPNQIVISIDIAQNGVWMQYADTWHPSWKATINGKPQELYIGSLAYKALPLERGKNIIRLYVESKPVVFLYGFMMLSSLVWILILIGLIIQ